eukprot:TRINITY_DN9579_c0_g1_i1.p1 TRINITY_DN9579_c0_g1~~TRINITY_DN9579_c0_g1_i1.p1  ORF type:complete len:276 (-),score=72.44 TRINITY_DN9579_c0_g1_i1:231-1058(-)
MGNCDSAPEEGGPSSSQSSSSQRPSSQTPSQRNASSQLPVSGSGGLKVQNDPRKSLASSGSNPALFGYDSRRILLKVILLGDSGVGKTSLMHRVVSQKFTEAYKTTIGADFMTTQFQIEDKIVTMQIWDTAGQERYESMGCAYFRGADACVLVFDINNPTSFQRLETWKEKFLVNSRSTQKRIDMTTPPPLVLVIANKIDQSAGAPSGASPGVSAPPDQWNATAQDQLLRTAQQWAQSNSHSFFETSAKVGTNVQPAFEFIARSSVNAIMGSQAL